MTPSKEFQAKRNTAPEGTTPLLAELVTKRLTCSQNGCSGKTDSLGRPQVSETQWP